MPTHGLKIPTHGLKIPTHGLKIPTHLSSWFEAAIDWQVRSYWPVSFHPANRRKRGETGLNFSLQTNLQTLFVQDGGAISEKLNYFVI